MRLPIFSQPQQEDDALAAESAEGRFERLIAMALASARQGIEPGCVAPDESQFQRTDFVLVLNEISSPAARHLVQTGRAIAFSDMTGRPQYKLRLDPEWCRCPSLGLEACLRVSIMMNLALGTVISVAAANIEPSIRSKEGEHHGLN